MLAAHLHGDVSCRHRNALKRFISAAARTAAENDAGRDVGDVHVFWTLLYDVHENLSWLTLAIFEDFKEGNNYSERVKTRKKRYENVTSLIYNSVTLISFTVVEYRQYKLENS